MMNTNNSSLLSSSRALQGAFRRIESGAGFNGACSSYTDTTGDPGHSDYSDYTDCPGE